MYIFLGSLSSFKHIIDKNATNFLVVDDFWYD